MSQAVVLARPLVGGMVVACACALVRGWLGQASNGGVELTVLIWTWQREAKARRGMPGVGRVDSRWR